MRILVVEDERLLCDGIAEDLRLEKYTVDCCYDGPAACERLFVEPYDLVLLDLNLPGMDGLELLRHIRTEQPGAAGADSFRPVTALRQGGRAGSGLQTIT